MANANDTAAKWNALSSTERDALLRKDRSMASKTWAPLRAAMVRSAFENLTNLQQDAVAYLFTIPARRR